MPPNTDPPAFDFENLTAVVALRQHGAFPAGTLTLASLELYREAWIAILWIEFDAFGDDFPHWVFNVTDDLGNNYIGRNRAGIGGGLPGGRSQHRAVVMFMPGLDPAAQTLTFELRAVQGTIGFTEGVGHFYTVKNVVGGPWTVDIPLQAAPQATNVELFSDDSPCPTFHADDVWKVVPVAQRQIANDYALTLYSLEFCRSGWIAVIRADYPYQHGPLPDRRRWEVIDDQGRDYRGFDEGGSGGGIIGQRMTWRMDYRFRPALGPDASRLKLMIDYIGSRPPPNPDGLHGTVVGPWTFEIELDAT